MASRGTSDTPGRRRDHAPRRFAPAVSDGAVSTDEARKPRRRAVQRRSVTTRLRKRDRQKRILTPIEANSSVGVSELAAELRVSKQTIRRDLDELSHAGSVNRLFGGAAVRRVGLEPTMMERNKMATAERAIIAQLAADLFSDGEVLMLGAGITTYYLAQKLAVHMDRLQVFTNNLSAGLALAANAGIRVVFTPGDLDPKEECMCGAETLAFIEKFRADSAVFGASGLFEDGACEVHSGIAWTDRAMIRQAHRRILLLDHSRFDRSLMELICPLSALDVLVTDRMPQGRLAEALQENGVSILCPGNG